MVGRETSRLPRPIDWFHRLPHILDTLDAPGHPALLTRQAIQTLFGVERRTAHSLLRRFGAERLGNALVVDRDRLAQALRQLASQDDVTREHRRHERVRETLAERRSTLRLARIALPDAPAVEALADLPPSIELVPGQLRIRFAGAVDLLSQLLTLSRAIGEDFERFEALLNQDPLASNKTPK